jgi:hypothetical protein
MRQCALPEFPGAATATDISVIAPGDSYFLAAVGTPVTDPTVTEDLGVRVDADPIAVLRFHHPRIADSPGDDGNTSVLSPTVSIRVCRIRCWIRCLIGLRWSVPTRNFPPYSATRRPHPDPLCPRPRLQNNIIQPKRLFPGMIRYANFCATGEPESLSEVMHDPK